MSTQTQSPTPPTPKGPRNSRRHPKKTTTPYTQKATLLTTPPSSPPRNLSPGGAATDSSTNVNLSKKKNPRSAKKPPRDGPKGSPFNNGHRHTSLQGPTATPQVKDSPHYAGPTFHASPAPSALPMPSFFSKSVPESDLAPTVESENEGLEGDPDLETTPSKPKGRPQPSNQGEQSTPLDFLFKAAVEARSAQAQRSPEAKPTVRSPQTDSKALPQRNPNGFAGGMFPMEMENVGSPNFQIGPSFAASYKDRMNALRSASSPSQSPQSLAETDDGERKAKTEALKSLLLNPRPQRPSSASPLAYNQTNSVKERPNPSPNVLHFATPSRTISGPPATASHGFSSEQKQPPFTNEIHSPQSYARMGGPQPSMLRKDIPTSGPATTSPGVTSEGFPFPPPPYMGYNQHNIPPRCAPPPQYRSPAPYSTASPAMPAHPSPQVLDTKKMEDDLRRILKLDVNSSFSTNGVQSSFA
ncbi:hypothetical protein SI65_01149 [Aspergillus cristatus]|uniref:Uncharacterized protein n=1 Tax=Aspergillus cristatus TaxID=573508 RepID=A0A1E3BRH5_ASPCR|nr:hypothetical protein SI65_01149 [Aspergillus cristatus]